MTIRAVLFDFSDTLFWRDGPQRVISIAEQHGVTIPTAVAARLWNEIKVRANTPEEIAKHRDTSADQHRACWTALYEPFEKLVPGIADHLYADQPNPEGWVPFSETVEVLRELRADGVPVGVVSDIGWDLRPIFVHYGIADCVATWVLCFAHGIEKPDPRMFTMGCVVLNVPPSETLMVGDNLLKDGGAVRAGLHALVLPEWPGVGERGLRPALHAAIRS